VSGPSLQSVSVALTASSAAATEALAARPARRLRARASRAGALILVVNANASGVRRQPELASRLAFVLRAEGAGVQIRVTESAAELATVAADPERRLVLLGGDGTVHGLANLPEFGAEIALLPVGGANNIARSLGLPVDLAEAARLAVRGRARLLDAIEARSADRRVVAVEGVSIGLHALARSRYGGLNSTDVRAAVGAGIAAVARFRPVRMALELDGEAELAALGQLFAANLPFYGPRLAVAPDADPFDGLIDVVTLHTRGRLATMAALTALRRGRNPRAVARRRARRVRVAAPGSPVIADTLELPLGTVDLTVRPGALRIVAPGR
jgi:diacylglycerol kinase family enzyme